MAALKTFKETLQKFGKKKIKGAELAQAVAEVPQTAPIKSKLIKEDKHRSDGSYAELVKDVFQTQEIDLEQGQEYIVDKFIEKHHAVTASTENSNQANQKEVETVLWNRNAWVTGAVMEN